MTINQSLTYPNWLNNVLNVQKFPISKLTPICTRRPGPSQMIQRALPLRMSRPAIALTAVISSDAGALTPPFAKAICVQLPTANASAICRRRHIDGYRHRAHTRRE
jgi:hypothetical protein